MFELNNVSFAYEENGSFGAPVLKNISLKIAKGEWWAIIGANGSGKSSLARHLNGLLLPNSGRVLVDGIDTLDEENWLTIRQKVGIVFQNPDNQIVGNSVEEDVAFGPENLGLPTAEIRKRVEECLRRVGLVDYAKADPNNLSGGQKQRVAIAGALAMQPEALILDEATAMLDPEGAAEVFAVLEELRQSGMTIVMITHNMAEVVPADKVAVLSAGEIKAVGTPAEVFARTDELDAWQIERPLFSRLGSALVEAGIGEFLPGAEKLPACLDMDELIALLCK